MTLPYQNFYFRFDIDEDNPDWHEVHVSAIETEGSLEYLWECTLKGLWYDDSERETVDLRRVWDMHRSGDYFQHTLCRHNMVLHRGQSYTAMFHDLIRTNRATLHFIQNIYSTSQLPWLGLGYTLYGLGKRFWDRQVETNLAEFVEVEGRYRALI